MTVMEAITVRADCRACGTICVSSIMCILLRTQHQGTVLWFMCPGCLAPVGIRLDPLADSTLRSAGAVVIDDSTFARMEEHSLEGPITVGEFEDFLTVLESDEDLVARLQESGM